MGKKTIVTKTTKPVPVQSTQRSEKEDKNHRPNLGPFTHIYNGRSGAKVYRPKDY